MINLNGRKHSKHKEMNMIMKLLRLMGKFHMNSLAPYFEACLPFLKEEGFLMDIILVGETSSAQLNASFIQTQDGDGYVVKVTFKDGRAHFKSSFVKTPEFLAEDKADQILYRGTFRTQRSSNNAFDLYLKNLANTNTVYWYFFLSGYSCFNCCRGGRLLTLFEAGIPFELDPVTLDTKPTAVDSLLGVASLRAGLPVFLPDLERVSESLHTRLFGCYFTAHPKIDQTKGRFISWLWRAEPKPKSGQILRSRPVLDIYEWDEKWTLQSRSFVRHRLQHTSVAPHDFSPTPSHYLFIENRLDGDILPYVLGQCTPAVCVNINPRQPMMLNLVPRRGSLNTTAVTLPLCPGFTIHSVCAFEKEGVIELYTTGWDCTAVATGTARKGLLGAWEGLCPQFDQIPCTYLYRTQIDSVSMKLLSHTVTPGMENIVVEHPHIHPAFESLPVRYMYMSIGSMQGVSTPPLGYLRLDLVTGEKQVWSPPRNTFCEELVVVPKSKEFGDEKNVWLISPLYDAVTNRSSIAVFDGENLNQGPIFRVWLQHPLPHSLHGSFTRQLFTQK
jgi:all-trans-8'-apo-beta-carotenal 15,15'-oxygenase